MAKGSGWGRPHLKGGRVRPLATGAKKRLGGLPDVPTSAEVGLSGWEMTAWFGVFAPRGTSADIVRILNEKLQGMLRWPKTAQRRLHIVAQPPRAPATPFHD